MAANDNFSEYSIKSGLKEVFPEQKNLIYSIQKCSKNEENCVLSVENKTVKQNYVLLKLPEQYHQKDIHNGTSSSVLKPIFTVKSNNGETYGGINQNFFEKFTFPQKNNYEHISTILETLVNVQVQNLVNNTNIASNIEYNINSLPDKIISLGLFNDIEEYKIRETLDKFQKSLDHFFGLNPILVLSYASLEIPNVFIDSESKRTVFVDISKHKLMPPVYDALIYLFTFTDEKFRKQYFRNLLSLYFKKLVNALKKVDTKLQDKISRTYCENTVRTLLPLVKLKIATITSTYKDVDLMKNSLQFLKYPLINQEDIYEAIHNKLGHSEYNLINYALKPLNETNGHLGEYFHLVIDVECNNTQQTINLFAKFLIPPTKLLKSILEEGPSKKEDFFYSTLLPLYREYGLDSILDFAPKCHLSRRDYLLLLDDKTTNGYKGLKPNYVLDYDELSIMVLQISKLHAATVILEEILSQNTDQNVQLGDNFKEYMIETILDYNGTLKDVYDKTLDGYFFLLEVFYPEFVKIVNKSKGEMRNFISKIFFDVFKKIIKSNTFRNVIGHGDLYVANMLFKYDEKNKVEDGILIDFQLLRYVPGSYDLLFFIYVNSNKETRDKYLTKLEDEYYENMSKFITEFGFNPQKVFPKGKYRNSLEYMREVSIISALNYAHATRMDPDLREEIMHDEDKFNLYFVENKRELLKLLLGDETWKNGILGLFKDLLLLMPKENKKLL